MSFAKLNTSSSRTLSDNGLDASLIRFVRLLSQLELSSQVLRTLKSEHKAMFSYRLMRPHSRGWGHSIYEAKAGCNEAKAEAVIFGLEAEAILRT